MSATNLDTFKVTFTTNTNSPDVGQPINFGCSIFISGSLGGGTIFLDLKDSAGNYIPYTSSISGATTQLHIQGVWANNARLRMTGGTAQNVTVSLIFNDNGQ